MNPSAPVVGRAARAVHADVDVEPQRESVARERGEVIRIVGEHADAVLAVGSVGDRGIRSGPSREAR